jgi:poly [ADP-ribose] polymerase 10/14/15
LAADVKVMQNLLVTLGGEGVKNLKAPDTWDDKEGIIAVAEGSAEYDEVVHYFLAALYEERDNVEIMEVERIQSMPLWQSYAVKKQTMKARDNKNPANLVNNRDLNGLERRWLFHGTRSEAIPQIVKQGFNRAFAGRNAVVYGKGVYFARDASYSSHRAYSQPDSTGVQHLFMCRVAVGDWCQGVEGMLTPATKPNNSLELFDTTVDDVGNPSVFVVYHDSQAYPDYLVSFRRND